MKITLLDTEYHTRYDEMDFCLGAMSKEDNRQLAAPVQPRHQRLREPVRPPHPCTGLN